MRLAIVGDICPDATGRLWRDATIPDLHRALSSDLVVGNFEATVDGPMAGDERFAPAKIRLSVPRDALARLRDLGVDAVSVANNHLWDYGEAAASHTVECLQSALGPDRVFGWAGRPVAEIAPSLRVLGVCFKETHPVAAASLQAANLAGRPGAAVSSHGPSGALIVFAHWGEEHLRLTHRVLRERARAMLAAGAAHVVGCHSHAVGAGERMDGRTVFYGLGNFAFRTIPEGNARMLGADRRGLAVVFAWDGSRLTFEECWESEFDDQMNVRLRCLGPRMPGSAIARAHLRLRPWASDAACAVERRTAWAWRGLARVLTGVERPSWHKVGTLVRGFSRACGGRGAWSE
jgi:hypothetical protein